MNSEESISDFAAEVPGGRALSNREIVAALNRRNGVPETERGETAALFLNAGHPPVARLIDRYAAAMDQDVDPDWLARKPGRPSVARGRLPRDASDEFDAIGIGGMFAYLNLLVHAHRREGKYCIVTHPRDIFTYSAWTLHPEEDMDQRLVSMFQTLSFLKGELKRILGVPESPDSLAFKSFKIDYTALISLIKNKPSEFLKIARLTMRYVGEELTGPPDRYARINLGRNAATVAAFKVLDRIGSDPQRDFLDWTGRLVFGVNGEPVSRVKEGLKREFGIEGETLSPEEVAEAFGAPVPIMRDVEKGGLTASRLPGGHFWAGFKENALAAARGKGVTVYPEAEAVRVIRDRKAGKIAVTLREASGGEKTVIARNLLMALGDYPRRVVPVDGVSVLFAVRTERKGYRIFPTAMGQGGTIHVVPVWTVARNENGKTVFYHLGKGTDGAIMGRDPMKPKRLQPDIPFLLHFEAYLKRIIPENSRLVTLAAIECGRPVCARQGYMVARRDPGFFEASGGSGLGGNTPVIPEVQAALKRS